MNASIVGVVFLVRYLCHAKEYLYNLAVTDTTTTALMENHHHSLDLAVEEDDPLVDIAADEKEQVDGGSSEKNWSLQNGDNEPVSEQLNTR
jgi:hypothetical protein